MSVAVRPATPADLAALGAMAHALWPDGSADEHAAHYAAILRGDPITTLPIAVFVAELAGVLVGFVEVDLRSHADGCDPAQPVGFVEGWFVDDAHRRSGVGGALIAAAEQWSRDHGARELGSDTWLDHDVSQRAHEALGFEVVDRCVHYRKKI